VTTSLMEEIIDYRPTVKDRILLAYYVLSEYTD